MQVGYGSRLLSTVHLYLLQHLIRFVEVKGILTTILRTNRVIVLKLFRDSIEKSLRLLVLHAGKH
jgi:hypothetical protein